MNSIVRLIWFATGSIFLAGCLNPSISRMVAPSKETRPLNNKIATVGDPAIYVNEANPKLSLVFGTDRRTGILAYDLEGKLAARYNAGYVYSLDVEPAFPMNGKKIVLLAAANRAENALILFQFLPETKRLLNITGEKIMSSVDGATAVCLFYSRFRRKHYAFLSGMDGKIEQWELNPVDGRIEATLVRTLELGDACLGLAADEELEFLYASAATKGIWKIPADPYKGSSKVKVDDILTNRNLKMEIRGLALFFGPRGKGYLLAVSQGNNSIAVYEREGDNRYLGSFVTTSSASLPPAPPPNEPELPKILSKNGKGTQSNGKLKTTVVKKAPDRNSNLSEEVDAVRGFSSIAVTNRYLNEEFPFGLLVLEDNANTSKSGPARPNYKFISWEKVARAFEPNLLLDPTYNPVENRPK
ncbi:MAG: phytase [Bacteroidetes bacterium]|nr:MAG: phytase [Bacteroidota bacterium]